MIRLRCAILMFGANPDYAKTTYSDCFYNFIYAGIALRNHRLGYRLG